MKQIPLSKGRFALVDDEDYDSLMQWKWLYTKGYAARRKSCGANGKRRWETILMHRVIMNTPKGMSTDHIDGDPLNNQKSNLRICTHAENMRNTTNNRKNNTSGYKGVTRSKFGKRWVARIKVNNRTKHIGVFDDIKDAASAYNKEAAILHKSFANPNLL